MSKFKVGDIIVGNEEASRYSLTAVDVECEVVKVYEKDEDGDIKVVIVKDGDFEQTYHVLSNHFNLAKPTPAWKVYIAGWDAQVREMFMVRGWEVVSNLYEADLVQFIGGPDIHPALYGEEVGDYTFCNPGLDKAEIDLYNRALILGKPLAGICRGAQLLHVMNGGSLIQHVDHHSISGVHPLTDIESNKTIPSTSAHHQAMRLDGAYGTLIAYAGEVDKHSHITALDVEAIAYDECLCFQPHPEFLEKDSAIQVYYFELLNELLLIREEE